jgi:hypothetical protein
MGQAITTIFTDILVYVLPMPVLWHVRLPLTQRIGLLALFGLGLFVCVAGILRTYYIYYVVYETFDVTWEGYNLWIWTALETHLGIIGGSIPSLKPLFFKVSNSSAYGSGSRKSVRLSGSMEPRKLVRRSSKGEQIEMTSAMSSDITYPPKARTAEMITDEDCRIDPETGRIVMVRVKSRSTNVDGRTSSASWLSLASSAGAPDAV